MSLMSPLTHRKIGALEVLVFVAVFEFFTFDYFAAPAFMGLAVLVGLGRLHFGGDFSIHQLYRLMAIKEKKESDHG